MTRSKTSSRYVADLKTDPAHWTRLVVHIWMELDLISCVRRVLTSGVDWWSTTHTVWHQKAFFSCRQSPSDLFWACWEASPLRPPFNSASRLLLLKNHQRVQDYIKFNAHEGFRKVSVPLSLSSDPKVTIMLDKGLDRFFKQVSLGLVKSSHLNASLSNCMSRVYSFSFCLHTCQSYSIIPWQWFLIKAQARVAPSSVTFWGNSLSAS